MRFPSSPVGRTRRTTIRTAKTIEFASWVEMYAEASDSMMPSNTPPRNAPGIEPIPPKTAAVKALTDVVVTSSNAKKIVETFDKDAKLIFGPDHNLGSYINSVTGRNMLLWNGGCHVHERFSVEKLVELKHEHPDAKVLVHPECRGAVVKLADVVGSTAALLNYAVASPCNTFLVVTESGILHEMQKKCPEKNFIPVPPDDSTCGCNECNFMRLCTLEKVYNTLRYEWPEIDVPADVAAQAIKPIERMLELSK